MKNKKKKWLRKTEFFTSKTYFWIRDTIKNVALKIAYRIPLHIRLKLGEFMNLGSQNGRKKIEGNRFFQGANIG